MFQYRYSNFLGPCFYHYFSNLQITPTFFLTTEFITRRLCYRSIIQNTSLFLWPRRSSNRLSVCFVIIQFFRSLHHFVSTELSQSSLCFVTAALSQSPLCFVTTALLNSSLCLSVDERSVSILVASLFCCYSIVEVSCLLLDRSIPGASCLSVSPQHVWCHLYFFSNAALFQSPLCFACYRIIFFQVACLAIYFMEA